MNMLKINLLDLHIKKIYLTEEGLARAVSAVKRQYYKPQEIAPTNVFNGNIQAENLQIGNNNTQNIENIKDIIIKEINKSNATKEEKNNAMNAVTNFFNNPVVSNTLELIKFGVKTFM